MQFIQPNQRDRGYEGWSIKSIIQGLISEWFWFIVPVLLPIS